MYLNTNHGRFARWREHRRVERQEARERALRQQEQIDQLLAEYPVERSRHANTHTGSNWGLAGAPWGGDGGSWSVFGGDWGGGGGDGGGC